MKRGDIRIYEEIDIQKVQELLCNREGEVRVKIP